MCVFAAYEGTVGRVPLVLDPGLVGLLPANQADHAGEAHGAVVAARRRLVVEARLGHPRWQSPSAQTITITLISLRLRQIRPILHTGPSFTCYGLTAHYDNGVPVNII